MRVAYLVTAHRNPQQLSELLRAVYDPRDLFIVHADARAPEVRAAALQFAREAGPNVHVVPGRKIVWGGVSQTKHQLRMMRYALQWPAGIGADARPWDYFINLSGQDYPLRTPSEIREDLARQSADRNYLEVLDYETASAPLLQRTQYYHFEFRDKVRRLKIRRKRPGDLHLYWGSAWFTVSRAFCALATQSAESRRVLRYIRFVRMSDEMFFQTLLMNSSLRETLVPENYRKIVWAGGSHPRTFTVEDTDQLLTSTAHFARKFDETIDSEILDLLKKKRLAASDHRHSDRSADARNRGYVILPT
jgi:hypothetical protein